MCRGMISCRNFLGKERREYFANDAWAVIDPGPFWSVEQHRWLLEECWYMLVTFRQLAGLDTNTFLHVFALLLYL